MKYYMDVFKKYATFTGRSRRSEYWYFVLFNFLISLAIVSIDFVVLGTGYTLYGIYVLITILPSLAVLVRRLHDSGKSGWYIFVGLIPLIGSIWLLVLLFTDSQPGPNEYGLNPKGIGNPDEVDNIGSHLV